jgi:hypothetical protein
MNSFTIHTEKLKEPPFFNKDENRLLELTTNRWDLSICTIDPHAVGLIL